MENMAEIDPYRVLGIDPKPNLTDAEIKKAYRKLALKLHPDKRKDSERERAQQEFDQLQKAYDILLDPEARAALENLAKAGLTHVHLLPSYDFGSVPERAENQAGIDHGWLASLPSNSDEQQAAVGAIANDDAFNWGYDPVHYGVPEGSYATDPDGSTRVVEFRSMVQGLNKIGLRTVCDVVYNHTLSAGPTDGKSVLDKCVPGYYHRRNMDGEFIFIYVRAIR